MPHREQLDLKLDLKLAIPHSRQRKFICGEQLARLRDYDTADYEDSSPLQAQTAACRCCHQKQLSAHWVRLAAQLRCGVVTVRDGGGSAVGPFQFAELGKAVERAFASLWAGPTQLRCLRFGRLRGTHYTRLQHLPADCSLMQSGSPSSVVPAPMCAWGLYLQAHRLFSQRLVWYWCSISVASLPVHGARKWPRRRVLRCSEAPDDRFVPVRHGQEVQTKFNENFRLEFALT
ncbi:hypothetical protein C8R45DRAFT_1118611 [Mycena sanguinolenta]|nr:hypothetical protein C8R45DRAFT_1118611 [Mycena sanguinolenta]